MKKMEVLIGELRVFSEAHGRYPTENEMRLNKDLSSPNTYLRSLGKRSEWENFGLLEKKPLEFERKCLGCHRLVMNKRNLYCGKSCAARANNVISPKRKKKEKEKCAFCKNHVLILGRKFCSSTCRKKGIEDFREKGGRIASRPKSNQVSAIQESIVCCYCGVLTKNKRYCSRKCLIKWRDDDFKRWMGGENSNLPVRLIKGMVAKAFGENCSGCGMGKIWNKAQIVIELEHKDGNSDNNRMDNLCLLCPNCHSQTPTYKSKNMGRGRGALRKMAGLNLKDSGV
jgi:hypothetical protein